MLSTLSSDEEMEISGTPPDVLRVANEAVQDLLPSKSRIHYEKAYDQFLKYRKEKNVGAVSENVLLAYLAEKAKLVKGSTLWSTYSMLKSTLNIKENVDVTKYSKVVPFLKKQMIGYRARKSKVFTSADICKFLTTAPDDSYLLSKVLLIIGVSGACRRDELVKMTVDDIQDEGSVVLITVPDTKTNGQRIFTIINPEYIRIFRTYAECRPPHVSCKRFFINYQKGKCTNQVVGINKIGATPSLIAKFLGLSKSELYTGHCFRRTSATLLANTGADITMLKRHGGWKSTMVAEGYVEDSVQNKMDIAKRISSCTTNAKDSNQNNNNNDSDDLTLPNAESLIVPSTTVSSEISASKSTSTGITISHCNNCTIHIVNNK